MLQELLAQASTQEIKDWINVNLANYLKKQGGLSQGQCEHIIDYLNSDKAPKRLKKMSVKEARSNAKKWVKALKKKGNNIIETESDIKTILNFKDGFKLVKLKTQNAFSREGNLMSHCVSSYYGKDDIEIYSLRDELNKPHATMEVKRNSGEIYQIKGKGNGSIHPNYINYVVQSLQEFGMKVRSSELENLGYYELSKETWGLIEKYCDSETVRCMNFGGKRYLYNGMQVKLKKTM